MKKIEAVIQSIREDDVVDALCKMKIGFSISEGKGCGGDSKDYTNIETIFTVVEDSNVKKLLGQLLKLLI